MPLLSPLLSGARGCRFIESSLATSVAARVGMSFGPLRLCETTLVFRAGSYTVGRLSLLLDSQSESRSSDRFDCAGKKSR